MKNNKKFTEKELETWIRPCDDEYLKKEGKFHLGVNQILTSPFIRQAWLDLISSSNFLNEYEPIENGRTWVAIDPDNRDISKPISITGGKYATVNWRASNHMRHRENEPAESFSGINRWIKYGQLHNVNGPAFAYDKHDEEKYSLWNLNVDEILIPRMLAQHGPAYYLFGQPLVKETYDKVINFSLTTLTPLEVAFVLVDGKSSLSEWNVDPNLPLLWQIKLAKSLIPVGQNSASLSLDKWLRNKYDVENNAEYDFSSDLETDL